MANGLNYYKTGHHKIYVKFSINEEGNLVDIKMNDQEKKCLEKEAARVVRKSPQWTPAYQNNKPVKVDITIPVSFVFP